MKHARIIIISLIVAIITVIVLYGVELPGHTMLWREIGNAGHIPLFGVMAVVLLYLSRALLGERFPHPLVHFGISFILTGGFGFITEFIQWFTPRDADFWDIVRDVIGAFVFLGVVALFDKKSFPGLRKSALKKTALILSVLIVLLAGMSPVIAWLGGYVYRSAKAPLICGFESGIDRLFIRMHSADIEFVPNQYFDSTESNETCVRITLRPAQYPEFYFKEPLPNWSPYNHFSYQVFSPADTAIRLYMRIEDVHHKGVFNDRFNRFFTIVPGLNRIDIPLEDIRRAPADREMDMTFISAFSLFAKDTRTPFELYLDNFELKK
ncbi:MAG: VanZ family protein [Candidatus Zixiibacteriota bacterium]